jgi:SWI/SNF-related matrix-associated actin-dependent regulator of chromatin subfamily A member 5
MMHRHGFGAARRIHLEIRRAWQFRFNWFFKSRNPQEIQKRCDILIRIVEREVQVHRDEESAKEEEEQHKLKEAQKHMEVEEQTPVQASVQPLPLETANTNQAMAASAVSQISSK